MAIGIDANTVRSGYVTAGPRAVKPPGRAQGTRLDQSRRRISPFFATICRCMPSWRSSLAAECTGFAAPPPHVGGRLVPRECGHSAFPVTPH